MSKKFYRTLITPIIILVISVLLLVGSYWSDVFICAHFECEAQKLKTTEELYQQIQSWPAFEKKLESLKKDDAFEGLFWKGPNTIWVITVKDLAFKHRIHHLNHTVQKKGFISTHTFEIEAAHDYEIMGFANEFLRLKMGYTQVQTFIIRLPTSHEGTTTATLIFNRMVWED